MKRLSLTFSGMDAKEMLIETGVVTDLCHDGIGIYAQRTPKPGIELALLIGSPDSDDHMCIPEARVAWVSGDHFGVSTRAMTPEDREKLRQMLISARGQSQKAS
jgi:hypothetical protein